MAAPTLVHGNVVDKQGRPVAGARVSWASGPVALPEVMLLSDGDGRFTLSAPAPGHYELRCDSDDHGSAQQALQASGKAVKLRLQLPG